MNRVRHIPWRPTHENVMPLLYIGHVPCACVYIVTPFGWIWFPVAARSLN